jgi:putrescine aminotransferase
MTTASAPPTATGADDRQRVLSALGRFWNPTAAVMLAAAHRTVEAGARGSEVIDEDGHRAIDVAGSYGVFLVGHGNERVRAAVLDALRTAPCVPPGAVHPAAAELFELIGGLLPPSLDTYVLGCSGADIVESALRAVHLARPGRRRIVVADGGYHGKTLGALRILGQPNHRAPFEPLGAELTVVPYGDAAALHAAVADRTAAAVFVEPVLGGAHLTVPPPGYLTSVAESCRQTGTLFVADEIQTCLGRTGRMFAIEHEGVVPDIMVFSKSLTGGMVPVGVCALSRDVVAAAREHPEWDPRLLSGSTAVSGLALAAAVAALREAVDQDLPGRCARLGPRLTDGLARLAARHPKHIMAAPGIGLMTGLKTRNPAVELLVSMGMARRGIHTGHSLNEQIDHPVLRFYPPATVSEQEIDRVLKAAEETLTWLDKRSRLLTKVLTWVLRRQYKLPAGLVLKLSGAKVRVDW